MTQREAAINAVKARIVQLRESMVAADTHGATLSFIAQMDLSERNIMEIASLPYGSFDDEQR